MRIALSIAALLHLLFSAYVISQAVSGPTSRALWIFSIVVFLISLASAILLSLHVLNYDKPAKMSVVSRIAHSIVGVILLLVGTAMAVGSLSKGGVNLLPFALIFIAMFALPGIYLLNFTARTSK